MQKRTYFVLQNAQVTADGSTAGVDLSSLVGPIDFCLVSRNSAGTTPTMAKKLQTSDTSGGTYEDVVGGAFTGLTTSTATEVLSVSSRALKKFVRVTDDIGGTDSPSYAQSVMANGQVRR